MPKPTMHAPQRHRTKVDHPHRWHVTRAAAIVLTMVSLGTCLARANPSDAVAVLDGVVGVAIDGNGTLVVHAIERTEELTHLVRAPAPMAGVIAILDTMDVLLMHEGYFESIPYRRLLDTRFIVPPLVITHGDSPLLARLGGFLEARDADEGLVLGPDRGSDVRCELRADPHRSTLRCVKGSSIVVNYVCTYDPVGGSMLCRSGP